MNKYMIEVVIDGVKDTLPIKAESEKKAVSKAMKMYKGIAFLGITERSMWKKKQFGSFASPTQIPMGSTYIKSSKQYIEEDINTYNFNSLEALV